MEVLERFQPQWRFNRGRSLAMLDEISKLPDPQRVLKFRPGPGRAHIAWQLLHVAITEELFATERLCGTPAAFSELIPRFKGGSVPDEDVPDVEFIRRVLNETRDHLLATVTKFTSADLATVPEAFRERGWNVELALLILGWHEAHHQGQAHLTLNLWKAAHP